MTGDNIEIAIKSQLEQFETILEDFAPIVATYLQSLCVAGVPIDIARDLVLQWHEICWDNTFNKGNKSD